MRLLDGLASLMVGLAVMGIAFSALAAPDPVKGEAVFQDRCSFCHQDQGAGQGPNLTGVVGRKAGSLAGFSYTDAMKTSGLTWTPQTLDQFLVGPGKMVPGTTMPMTVPDDGERADLIAYLASKK